MDHGGAAFAGLLGRCPAMEDLRREIARFGPDAVRVHVWGETGTGKERVARALHRCSPRRARPFVPVNVAGFTDELFVAEMFGHARGAFTGAVGEREGCVGRAQGGTLFIDEVAEMTPLAQVRLLRFLQESEYQRVGESETRRCDVRVISATNACLEELVREGRFRKDLWFRLQGQTLRLPPLRERGEDVLLLARHFLGRELQARGSQASRLSPEVERALARHAWPGNVRELENEMMLVAVRAAGRVVRLEDLSPALREPGPPRGGGLKESLLRLEREIVQATLARHRGVVSRAAAELGISRQALWAKLRNQRRGGSGAGRCYPRRPSGGEVDDPRAGAS
jgi:DNA-binding NtrC family response regulator